MAIPKRYVYRYCLIWAFDAVVITWLVMATYGGPGEDDFFGLFLLAAAAALVVFNIYAHLLARFFFRKGGFRWYIEAVYCLLLALPIVVLYYRTR